MNSIYIIFLAALFGLTMKLADLTDEHGLKLFKHDQLIFGILWGGLGVLLVLARADIANMLLAMMVAYIIRLSLDYRNHAVAAAMILIAFVWRSSFIPSVFLWFFIPFLVFGSLRDYLGNVRKTKDFWYKINEPAWYYYLPPILFSLVTGNWYPTVATIVFRTAYNLTKLAYRDF